MTKWTLINICLLHSGNALHTRQLMIIYTEKKAKLYIMHVMRFSGNWKERDMQITHKQETVW